MISFISRKNSERLSEFQKFSFENTLFFYNNSYITPTEDI